MCVGGGRGGHCSDCGIANVCVCVWGGDTAATVAQLMCVCVGGDDTAMTVA